MSRNKEGLNRYREFAIDRIPPKMGERIGHRLSNLIFASFIQKVQCFRGYSRAGVVEKSNENLQPPVAEILNPSPEKNAQHLQNIQPILLMMNGYISRGENEDKSTYRPF